MPSLPCPSCGRALNFPESLRGALVQCPACRHSFTAPEEEPPAPARPPAVPLARPVSPAAPEPFDLSGPLDALEVRHALEVRRRSALRSAAWWLLSAVVVDFAASLVGCCTLPVLSFRPDAVANLVLAGAVPFEYLPLIVVAAGLTHLKERRSYRLCLASAISVLPPSLWALLRTWALGRAALDELARGEPGGFIFLPLAGATLFGAAAGVIGAVKALALLSDAEVRRSFH